MSDVQVTINIEHMTLNDLALIQEFQQSGEQVNVRDVIQMFDRLAVVEGVESVGELEIADLSIIGQALEEVLGELQLGNSGGG